MHSKNKKEKELKFKINIMGINDIEWDSDRDR